MKGNFVRRPYHDLGPWPATRLELPLRDENCVERWVACYHLSMTANSPSVRPPRKSRRGAIRPAGIRHKAQRR